MQDLKINWYFHHFSELTLGQLYDLLAERQRVFIIEQTCLFPDIDGLDQKSWHLLGYSKLEDGSQLVAYSRILPAGLSFAEASIGRIITSKRARGTGAGIELMEESIRHLEKMWGKVPIKIGAQEYLIKFYRKFGFEIVDEPYVEDGIPHVHMLRQGGGL
ncbi:MAG: GNAT family N-acetyltransferase [Calditrichaeota bacterium]|nr:MAG: GNAT family N-acetyltransferase [Calditrichota bacterium]